MVPFLIDVVQDRLYGYPCVSIFGYASVNVLCSWVYNGKSGGRYKDSSDLTILLDQGINTYMTIYQLQYLSKLYMEFLQF